MIQKTWLSLHQVLILSTILVLWSFCLWQWHLCTADQGDCYPQMDIMWQDQGKFGCVRQSVDLHDIYSVTVYELFFALVWPCYVSELSGTQSHFILNGICVFCVIAMITLMLSSVSYSFTVIFHNQKQPMYTVLKAVLDRVSEHPTLNNTTAKKTAPCLHHRNTDANNRDILMVETFKGKRTKNLSFTESL